MGSAVLLLPLHRWLDDGGTDAGGGDDSNSTDGGDNSPNAFAPTSAPVSAADDRGMSSVSIVFILILSAVAAVASWRLYTWWRRRREQQLLQYRSDQANRVLGDMQMVPNEDLDDGLI